MTDGGYSLGLSEETIERLLDGVTAGVLYASRAWPPALCCDPVGAERSTNNAQLQTKLMLAVALRARFPQVGHDRRRIQCET